MLEKFRPSYHYKSIGEIEPDFFKKHGIRFVMLDIDNTLVGNNIPEPDEKALLFLQRLKREGIAAALVSNNHSRRVQSFNRDLGLPAAYRAGKPMTWKMRQMMKKIGADPKQTAFIGDQLFTDIYGANRLGVISILVDPISRGRENKFFDLKRKLEQWVFKQLEKEEHRV